MRLFLSALAVAVALAAGWQVYQWKLWAQREMATLHTQVIELQERAPISKDELTTLRYRAARGELAARWIEKNLIPKQDKKK